MGLTSDDVARITRSKSKSIKCYCSGCNVADDKFVQLEKRLTDLFEKKFTSLETKLNMMDKIYEENKQLKETIAQLSSRIDSIEQYERRNNLEIQGVLESRDEPLWAAPSNLGILIQLIESRVLPPIVVLVIL